MSGPVETLVESRLWRIRLNRGERRNTLNRESCRALLESLRAADRDEDCGAVLLESTGPVFCGGWDPDEPATAESLGLRDALLNFADEVGKPVVAAVQGPALGPGVALLANAVVVVAAQGVTFAMTEIRGGQFPYIAFGPLARAVGERRAMELCVTGRVFTVPEAMDWGLVQHTAPAFEFDDRAFGIAEQLAGSNAAVMGLKWARRTQGMPLRRTKALKEALDAVCNR